jgi:hypothetical protein
VLVSRDPLPAVPRSPFAPVPTLFLTPADSDLRELLEQAHALIESCPTLIDLVEADLDAHALRKKALRVADGQWLSSRNLPLPGVVSDSSAPPSKPLVLLPGRPRTPGYVVLMSLLLRGYLGAGFKACESTSLMQESITLQILFANLGLKLPGRSTLSELSNAISNDTRQRILDAQTAHILKLKLDDFRTLLGDSTHVEGNTAWPTDSRLMVALGLRMVRIGESLPRLELPAPDLGETRGRLAVMKKLDREIDMARGKKDGARTRRRRYQKLLKAAGRVHQLLAAQVAEVDQALTRLDVLPSRKELAARAVAQLHADLGALAQVIANCTARVLRDEKIKMADKVLSVSDPDAGFIAKGQREAVIGYKPQLGRSGAGFIPGLLLPQGNAADSAEFVPLVEEVIRCTGVVPEVVSVDDGYASATNVSTLKERGIKVVSINGAKGRALTARADWDSQAYADARDLRSAVESLMFTLKQGFHFGEVARRGLAAVHAELLEKALAYNLCHMVRVRKAAEAPPELALTG